MAKRQQQKGQASHRGQTSQKGQSSQRGRTAPRREEESQVRQAGETGGFREETRWGKEHQIPKQPIPGRTIGDTATSYSSVGGAEEPEEWAQRVPEPDDNAPDYETRGGVQPDEPEATSGPVHDVSFRPGPGGVVEERSGRGKNIPYTGEVASTRDAPFEEDPSTGETGDEEREALLNESLEKRSRRFETG